MMATAQQPRRVTTRGTIENMIAKAPREVQAEIWACLERREPVELVSGSQVVVFTRERVGYRMEVRG